MSSSGGVINFEMVHPVDIAVVLADVIFMAALSRR